MDATTAATSYAPCGHVPSIGGAPCRDVDLSDLSGMRERRVAYLIHDGSGRVHCKRVINAVCGTQEKSGPKHAMCVPRAVPGFARSGSPRDDERTNTRTCLPELPAVSALVQSCYPGHVLGS